MKHLILLDFAHSIMDGFTAHKGLIAFIVIGCIAGLIAQLVLPGRGHGLVATALIGIAGCFLGVMFINRLLTFLENHILREFIGAVFGALIVQLLYNLVVANLPQHIQEKLK